MRKYFKKSFYTKNTKRREFLDSRTKILYNACVQTFVYVLCQRSEVLAETDGGLFTALLKYVAKNEANALFHVDVGLLRNLIGALSGDNLPNRSMIRVAKERSERAIKEHQRRGTTKARGSRHVPCASKRRDTDMACMTRLPASYPFSYQELTLAKHIMPKFWRLVLCCVHAPNEQKEENKEGDRCFKIPLLRGESGKNSRRRSSSFDTELLIKRSRFAEDEEEIKIPKGAFSGLRAPMQKIVQDLGHEMEVDMGPAVGVLSDGYVSSSKETEASAEARNEQGFT